MEKEFDQNKNFVPNKSFSEYVEEWKNGKKDENPFMQTVKIEQLEKCINEFEEEKTTETKIEIQQIKKMNFHIEKTVCCNFVVRKNFNYCPNCGRRIKK